VGGHLERMDAAGTRTTIERTDAWQQDHRPAAVGVATGKKFAEDHSPNLAALLAFWGFFSIFPLILVAATLLGWFLPSDASEDTLSRITSYVPLIDFSGEGISGSWWALALGLVSALWGASGMTRTARFAFDSVWEVPYAERAGIVRQTLDGLIAIGAVGLLLVASIFVTGLVSGTGDQLDIGALGRIGGYAIAVVVDVVAFVIAFRLLTSRDVTIREVLPGAILAGVGFWILQSLSSVIISRYLQNAGTTYGNFATVITVLWWFYLSGLLTLFGAQLNVVLRERLWPRSLRGAPSTPADRRALRAYARERTYVEDQEVDVTFSERRNE
jgi:membrane protein